MPYSKYSAKQRRLAAVAPPRTKITGADLLNLEKRKRRENETYNPSKKYFKKTSGDTRPYKGAYGFYEA